MRLIGKLLALPFMLVTGILYLVCKFLVVLSGAVPVSYTHLTLPTIA